MMLVRVAGTHPQQAPWKPSPRPDAPPAPKHPFLPAEGYSPLAASLLPPRPFGDMKTMGTSRGSKVCYSFGAGFILLVLLWPFTSVL